MNHKHKSNFFRTLESTLKKHVKHSIDGYNLKNNYTKIKLNLS